MMNLSKIIKHGIISKNQSEVLRVRPVDEEISIECFHSYDSLWQSPGGENVETISKLEKEKLRIKAETEELLENARNQVEQIEKEAREKGYAAGKEEALAEEKITLSGKVSEFDSFLKALEVDRKQLNVSYEKDIITLVKTMVDRVLFHEASVNPMVIEVCLKTAMSYVVENSKIKIHLNAKDLDRLKEASVERPDLLAGTNKIELTEDPGITEGGCLLETGFGDVDATLESRKDRLYEAIDAIFQKVLMDQ